MRSILRKLTRVFWRKTDPRVSLLKKMPKRAVCAEIGVWKGAFSARIQNITSPRKLHLIDPWTFQSEFPERRYGGSAARDQMDMDRIYQSVRNRFNSHPNIILHREKSENVLQEFDDAYFDWVYIDGNHYYEFVLKDLQICLSKVKPGGIIAGDDYKWGKKDGFPVKRAVQHFIEENNLEDNLELLRSQFIIKLPASNKRST